MLSINPKLDITSYRLVNLSSSHFWILEEINAEHNAEKSLNRKFLIFIFILFPASIPHYSHSCGLVSSPTALHYWLWRRKKNIFRTCCPMNSNWNQLLIDMLQFPLILSLLFQQDEWQNVAVSQTVKQCNLDCWNNTTKKNKKTLRALWPLWAGDEAGCQQYCLGSSDRQLVAHMPTGVSLPGLLA